MNLKELSELQAWGERQNFSTEVMVGVARRAFPTADSDIEAIALLASCYSRTIAALRATASAAPASEDKLIFTGNVVTRTYNGRLVT